MPIHQNYIESSNLMLLSAGLGIVNVSLMPNAFSSGINIFTWSFAVLFIVGIAILIRKGLDWIKYVLLTLMILGIFSLYLIIKNLQNNPVIGIINIIQTVFQVWALLLLFRVPNENAE